MRASEDPMSKGGDNSGALGTLRGPAAGPPTVIEVDEVIEGTTITSRNYRFSRIGLSVPVKPDFHYDSESPPAQPLAVSQRFRLIFVAHSDGFYVARTEQVIAAAEKIKEEKSSSSIAELSFLDVPIGEVSILALSAGDSLLAASIANQLHFFSISALLHKEQKPSYSVLVGDSGGIKDFKWARKAVKDYVVLSTNGKLYRGSGQGSLMDIMVDVDAVECSAKGDFIAVAKKNILSIMSSDFVEKFRILLSPESLIVDSVRWIRGDSIVLGCFEGGDDSEPTNYLVQVITSQLQEITDVSSKPIVLSFSDMFYSFQPDAVPCASGPNLFLSYLDHHGLAFVANRKNPEQHVVLMGWSLNDKENEVTSIDVSQDNWCASIELQGNDDDNLVLALSVDKISQDNEIKFSLGEVETEVSPCCVLLCLTIDGKLVLFHFVSAAGASIAPEILADSDGEEDPFHEALSQNQSPKISSEVGEKSVELTFSGLKSNDGSKSKPQIRLSQETCTENNQSAASCQKTNSQSESSLGNQEQKPLLDFQKTKSQSESSSGNQEQKPLPNFQTLKGDQKIFTVNSDPQLEQSSFRTSHLEVPRVVAGNISKIETHVFAEAKPLPHSVSGKVLTDLSSQSVSRNLQGSDIVEFPGKAAPMKSANESSLMSSMGSIERKSSGNAMNFAGRLFQYPSYSKDTTIPSVTIDSSEQKAITFSGNITSLPALASSQVLLQENFASAKSSKSRLNEENVSIPSRTGLPIAEQNLLKQIRKVEEMAKQMDHLMEAIEGSGGFKDASVASRQSSVAELDEDLLTLSEKCTMWRGVLDERLREIQLLLDKTVQVLARKVYIKDIFKQATDRQYWDLWNCQKLSSELELKRQHIVEVNQDLTSRLLELERHFNTIELNKFGESRGVETNRRAMQSRHGISRQVQSLHSLRNTMDAQLAAAEKLSECLSKQMAVLSIVSPVKKQNIKRELFETIGLTYDAASYNSPGKEKAFGTPSRNQLPITSFSTAAKEELKRNQTAVRGSEPESVRRRRESLDKNWSSFEPPRTTVKRILLEEGHGKISATKSPLRIDEQCLKLQPQKESAVLQSSFSDKSITPSYEWKSKAKQSIDRPLTSSLRWADGPTNSGIPVKSAEIFPSTSTGVNTAKDTYVLSDERSRFDSKFLGEPRSFRQSEMFLQNSPFISDRSHLGTMTSNKGSLEIQDSSDTELDPSKSKIRSDKHSLVITESALTESDGRSKTSLSLAGTVVSLPSYSKEISHIEIAANKRNPVETTSSSSALQAISTLPSTINSSAATASFPKLSATSSPAISSTRFGSSSYANTDANQKVSQSETSVPTFSNFPSLSFSSSKGIELSSTAPTSISGKSMYPESVSHPNIALFGSRKDENFIPQTTGSNSTLATEENLKIVASVSQPLLPIDTSNLKLGHRMLSAPTAELSSSLKSENQLNMDGKSSPVSDLASNVKPEQSNTGNNSPTAILNFEMSNNGKSGSLDEASREDEMEEEAPEASLTTELALGNLGGFGIGSAPNSTSVKPTPFGLAMPNKPAIPVSSPFTMLSPSGELFRPASFSFQSPLPSQPSQPASIANFASGTSQVPTPRGFGQPAQIGSGQQALGSVLGTFGQSRQLGAGLPGSGIGSPSGFSSGFPSTSSGGFGGGFATVASSGGGFANLAMGGAGGFAAASTPGGGFAAAATPGGGFAAAASTPGGGFAAAAPAATGFSGGGFGVFGNQQVGGFSAFGSSTGTGRPPSELFTQMRK